MSTAGPGTTLRECAVGIAAASPAWHHPLPAPAFVQIAEDQPLQLDAQMPGGRQRVADLLVPRMLTLMGAPSADIRALTVSTLNQLANIMPNALMENMDRWVVGGMWRWMRGAAGD